MDTWPALPYNAWRDTYETLHMWSQVVGKVALALTPRTNHFWNIALIVNARGLSTHALTAGDRTFTITFDFVDHRLVIVCSDGGTRTIALAPKSVAAFYAEVMAELKAMGVDLRIWTMPVEVPNPIRFELDTQHQSYDRQSAEAFWHVLLAMRPVFEEFRCRFVGKSSPVHFFWGSFDLASTRFSGRRAPERAGADAVTQEAYSHEVISHGFWPGAAAVPEPVFYAYAAPEPQGFAAATVRPAAASYKKELAEFLLPYDAVRQSAAPAKELMAFLETTYAAGADLGHWERRELERS
jgi:hypothetical protein